MLNGQARCSNLRALLQLSAHGVWAIAPHRHARQLSPFLSVMQLMQMVVMHFLLQMVVVQVLTPGLRWFTSATQR